MGDIPPGQASGPKREPKAFGQLFPSFRDREFRNSDLRNHPSLQAVRREFLDEAAQAVEHEIDERCEGLTRDFGFRSRDADTFLRIHHARQRPALMLDSVAAFNKGLRPGTSLPQVFGEQWVRRLE